MRPTTPDPDKSVVLMRVLVAHILDLTLYEFFSGTPAAPAWVGFADRASGRPSSPATISACAPA